MVNPPSQTVVQRAYTSEPKHLLLSRGDGHVEIRDAGSDGNESRHPPTGILNNERDDKTKVLQVASAKTKKHWCDDIGNFLIKQVGWDEPRCTYSLWRFPKGYKLYTCVTSDAHGKFERTDSYLYGSTTKGCRRFRSPEEFVLHAKWMAFGRPRDELGRPLCACRYCSNTKQDKISTMLKGKVKNKTRTERARARDGERRRRRRPKRKTSPEESVILAKDYTGLNRGEGVRVHDL